MASTTVRGAVPELVITTIIFTYDSLYRSDEYDYSSRENFQFAYDAVGNMTAVTPTATVVSTRAYDAANRLITVTTDGDVRTLDWSAAGELLRDGSDTYTWDAAGRSVSATVDGVTSRYAYLGDGDRISMTVGSETTTYTLDLVSPLVQVLVAHESTNFEATIYLYGMARVGEEQPEGWLYYANDHHSVRQLVDGVGNVKLAQGYRPYGQVLWREGTGSSVFGFTGEQVDPTGLVYLRARMYAPEIGGFISQDTIVPEFLQPQSLNLYAYTSGNPLRYIDPSGNSRIPPLADGTCHPGLCSQPRNLQNYNEKVPPAGIVFDPVLPVPLAGGIPQQTNFAQSAIHKTTWLCLVEVGNQQRCLLNRTRLVSNTCILRAWPSCTCCKIIVCRVIETAGVGG